MMLRPKTRRTIHSTLPRCGASAHFRWGFSLALTGVLWSLGVSVQAAPSSAYTPMGRCGDFPKVAVQAPAGWCVGLAADARDGLRMPRRLLEVAAGVFWVVDMGNWEPHQGRLLEFRPGGPSAPSGRWRVLAQGLDRPHGLALGPDGKVYIGEAGRVWRTKVAATVEPEEVLRDLPQDGAHPLKELVFLDSGPRSATLLVNVGSASDACRDAKQQQALPCPEVQGRQPRAAVYLAELAGPDLRLRSWRPWATGLRNSLGLAVVKPASGPAVVWQAENSVDYVSDTEPAEELNRLEAGTDHGWPYCVSNAQGKSVAAHGYEGRVDCGAPSRRAPQQAWPAHTAPLQLLAVPAGSAGAAGGTPWEGRLLALWHGYRAPGHRIVAWRLGPQGQPVGPQETLLSGWDAKPGVRPLGAPAGATVDSQGRLWVVEDRNHTLLVVTRQSPSP